MSTQTVMVIEDDAEIGELMGLYLEREGYRVVYAESGEQGLELLPAAKPDLILMDILLPGMSGMTVCMEVRKVSEIPIIFMSCKRDNDDIVEGLSLGGNDYITKPFNPSIMVARVKSNLRRSAILDMEGSRESLWSHGHLEIDLRNEVVRVRGKQVPLFVKERQLLFYLLKNPNRVFSISHLFEHIWGADRESDERTVMVHMSNLRKKIEDDPSSPQYVRTVRGVGYKFHME
ncbi:DNA-binding response regulator [Paenibacillus selenitireducens]|uniref:DNA-binding response regulator n=1 Tax=Paenibacillus selenitireducens TaxID=1324314 RepID=A0A1T2XAM6_9BACL|nr:response regulator transcription factor [Paenibacillus selenitireducens]OPA76947.1 DNA-binding response regulator [Paenibacillus selenitireducens]